MTLDLTGRVALVTGGGRGIGAGVAELLASAGASVVVADLDFDGATAVAQEVGGLAVRCDVSALADNETAVQTALDTYGRLDIAVLNAGIETGTPAGEFDEAAYRRAMGVNLDGVVFGIAATLPALRAGGGGRIVAVASLAGLSPQPVDPVYSANKAAVVSYVRALGPVLAPEAILLNAVCPGYTDTAILDPWRDTLAASNWPVMAVADVVDAVATVLQSDASGQAWLAQYGLPVEPYRFRGVPGPRVDGQS